MSIDSTKQAVVPSTKKETPPAFDGGSFQPLTSAQEARLLAVLTGVMFVALTSVNMLAPLLLELASDFNTTVGAMGQLAAVAAIPWGVLAPFMGVLSDRYGRRPVLALGLLVVGATTLASAFATDYTTLLVLRFLSGVGGATTGPNTMAASVEYFPPSRRGRAMGIVLAGLSLSTVIGAPAVALASAVVGWRLSFVGVSVLLLGIAAAVWVVMPGRSRKAAEVNPLSGLTSVFRSRKTVLLLIANMLERVSFIAATTYLAAFLMVSYSLGLEQVAPVLTVMAAGTLVGSLAGGRLADRGGQRTQYAVLLVLTALAAYPLFNTTPGLVITCVIGAAFGVTGSLARPAWLWMLTRVPPEVRGATTGFAATSNQLGVTIGASIGGVLVGAGGFPAIGLFAAATALASAAVCLTVSNE